MAKAATHSTKVKSKSKAVSKDELIDNHVSSNQCKKAVDALMTHVAKVVAKRDENELLGGKEENVWLVLTVKRSHAEKKLKPQRIPLRYPVVDPRTTSICLITKDPQREYKDLLEQHGIKFISRVVGIEKLKGKFRPFEARRMLLKENGLFLTDERVVPLLPGLLGKKFFEAKKQPIPVNLTKRELKTELELAVSSSYFHQNQGTCTSIKIGTLSHTPAQVLENLKTALPAVIKKVRGGWDNVQSFNIKTNSSTSLPIWSCSLDNGAEGRWGGVEVKIGDEEQGESGESGDESEEKDSGKAKRAEKGKKREAEAEEATPKKKVKKSDKDTSTGPAKAIEVEQTKSKMQHKSTKPVTDDTTSLVQPTETSKKTKRKEKLKANTTEAEMVTEPPTVPAPASESIVSPAAESESTPPSDKPKKKQKKQKTFLAEEPIKDQSPTSPEPTPASTIVPKGDKPKKDTSKKSTLTSSEVKEKLSTQGIEKKKVRIAKESSGKVKEGIIGKKAKAKI